MEHYCHTSMYSYSTCAVILCKGEHQTTVQKETNLEVAVKLRSSSSAVKGETENDLYNLVKENRLGGPTGQWFLLL